MQLTRTALELDGQPVALGDILAAAALRGALDRMRQSVRSRLAAAAVVESRGGEIDAATLQAELDRWRTEHDLIAAEEAEAWLGAYGLELDQLLTFLEKRLLAQLPSLAACEAQIGDDDVAAVLVSDIIFADQWRPLTIDFALRSVVDPVEDGPALATEVAVLLEEQGLRDDAAAAAAVSCFEVLPGRAAELLTLEATFRIRRRELTNDAALARALDDHGQQFVLMQTQTVTVTDEDAARELICCVRDDGDTLSAAASRAAAVASDATCFIRDLDDSPLGQCIRSAVTGELFGPINVDDGVLVGQLLERVEPVATSTDVRARIEALVLDRTLQPRIAERVRFILPW